MCILWLAVNLGCGCTIGAASQRTVLLCHLEISRGHEQRRVLWSDVERSDYGVHQIYVTAQDEHQLSIVGFLLGSPFVPVDIQVEGITALWRVT